MRKLSYEQIMSVQGFSSRAAAKQLGVGKSTINEARAALREGQLAPEAQQPRILTLDIESKPLKVYTWGIWDQNIGLSQIVEDGGMICFAAKWLDSDEILFFSDYADGHDGMVSAAWNLLNEADILVTYNGKKYDEKRLNNEFVLAGLMPPSPYKSVDLIQTNRQRFDFPSRKLDFIAQRTGVGAKIVNSGFDLWIGCMANDPESWRLMEEYNRGDIVVTEDLYKRLLPWLVNPPHYARYSLEAEGDACPYCGGVVVESGVAHTAALTYQRLRCVQCGGWSRSSKKLADSVATTTRAIR